MNLNGSIKENVLIPALLEPSNPKPMVINNVFLVSVHVKNVLLLMSVLNVYQVWNIYINMELATLLVI
jgi:hypothetical protein